VGLRTVKINGYNIIYRPTEQRQIKYLCNTEIETLGMKTLWATKFGGVWELAIEHNFAYLRMKVVMVVVMVMMMMMMMKMKI
jgi:hypothetical protein